MPDHAAGTLDCLGLDGWRWLNEPSSWKTDDEGLEAATDPDTDFWVTTHYGFVRDTGHALLRPLPSRFRMRVTFAGRYQDQYDQAGLLLRADEQNWMKTGIEYVDGRRQLSAVVTRGVSDWNVVPLERVLGEAEAVTVEMERDGDTLTVRYGAAGQEPDTMLRLAYFPPDAAVSGGPMCASPDGTGFTTRFTGLHLET